MDSEPTVRWRMRACPFCVCATSAWLTLAAAATSQAAELPVPCVAGACSGVTGFVTSGIGSASSSGNTLNVNQLSDTAIFNWRSFNISADGKVRFNQPDAASLAINRIFDLAPSRISGSLTANGRLYLINQNGILFGNGAQVNVGGLVASSLDITPEALANGVALAYQSNAPAFAQFTDANGNKLPSGSVQVEQGASITSEGGQVLLFAPVVTNEGTLRTPDGQTILAAGDSVYLASSSDPNLRGLLVEVGIGGTVTNGSSANANASRTEDLVGQIVAERGNITLAGLAVNQLGRVSANTSVRSNGSIRLLARDGAMPNSSSVTEPLQATRGGELTLGKRSSTTVTLVDDEEERTVDINAQPRSQVELEGHRISVLNGASIKATSGEVSATARRASQFDPGAEGSSAESDGSRIYIAADARIDVSGASAELDMEDNLLRVELRGTQLANSPVQRDGALRGKTVYVDARVTGTREDGSTWVGSPIGDLAGDVSTIQRSVTERNLAGGTVTLRSQGDVIVSPDATIDISGGSVRYRDGFLNTTQLLGADGRIYDIGSADPDRVYTKLAGSFTVEHKRWGVAETFTGYSASSSGRFVPGYVEGKDAGTLNVLGTQVALDGNVIARTTVGRNQRLPARSVPEGMLYRPFDQVPLGGQLVVGNGTTGNAALPNYLTQNVLIAPGQVLPSLLNDEGLPFDPLRDELPEALEGTTRVRPELVGANGINRLSIFANGHVLLSAEVSVSTPLGGEVRLTGANVTVDGSIDAPSGQISTLARQTLTQETDFSLTVGPESRLTARGQWVNDDERLGSATERSPLFIDGGSVSLTAAQGSLNVAEGSLIDVSGGAWRDKSGHVTGGRGGSITAAATPTASGEAVELSLEGEMRAFAMTDGGTLSISANEICIASLTCPEEATTFWVSPERLMTGGFGEVRLASNLRGLTLTQDTVLDLEQTNLELTVDPQLVASGTDFSQISRPTRLADPLRRPMNLSLSTSVNAGASPFDAARFREAPGLRLEKGSVINLDPGAQVDFSSNTRLIVEGSISAPAGSIDLRLENDLAISEFLPSQAIWLGADSLLSVPGTALITVDDQGLRQGEVLEGGRISIDARRGSIVALPGSRIEVSGTRSQIDIRKSTPGQSRYVRETVASNAGSVALSAAEGMLLGGSFDAQGGDASAAGGSLSVTLNASTRNDPGEALFQSVFPLTDRQIVVSDAPAPFVVQPGSAIPLTLNGIATLSASEVAAGGFDFLSLAARDVSGVVNGAFSSSAAKGRIAFQGDVDLTARARLRLDATSISSDGGSAHLASDALAIGNFDVDAARQVVLPAPATGTGELVAEANHLELVGNLALEGFREATFASTGDIRLRGLETAGKEGLHGSLTSTADMTFRSAQLYPSTLTEFSIANVNGDAGLLRFESVGAPSLLLSAGGTLRASAARIEQAGVLRAPFGTIQLDAGELVMEPGSLTSTTGKGAVVPFGTIQGGFDWTYQIGNQTVVFGENGVPVPQQRVLLNGERIEFQDGAVVDVSAGGDLQAYEFVPGTTGNIDVLSAQARPGQFAILPQAGLEYAPYDPSAHAGSDLQVGDSLYLSGFGDLPAGTYTLLPARYALLPGAYLVTAVDGYRDIQPSQQYGRLDGSTIVSGYRTIAGTSIRDSRTSGFAVRKGSDVQDEARYNLSRATAFFREQAERLETSTPRLPVDAGVLVFNAGSSLQLNGQLRAAREEGGRGAGVDLASQRLAVISDPGDDPMDGSVLVDAASLSALGAESVLLGGTRSDSAEGILLTATAEQVTVAANSSVSAPELMLLAKDRVVVGENAQLTASGVEVSDAASVQLGSDDSALVRLSTGGAVAVGRGDVTGLQGTVDIREGATLTAIDGSIALDSSRDTLSAGDLVATGGALSLGATRILLGDDNGFTDGLVLTNEDLAAFSLSELRLTSRSTIDVSGDVAVDVGQLFIDAAAVVSSGSSTNASLRADRITLANSDNRTAAHTAAGGRLSVSADEVRLGAGSVVFGGFEQVDLNAGGRVLATEDGALAAGGDLNIAAGTITGAAGIDYDFSALGRLSITGSDSVLAGAALDGAIAPGLGARLNFTGSSIEHSGRIETPAGIVQMRATGTVAAEGIRITGGSIDASGRVVEFDGVPAAASGGLIRLTADSGNIDVDTNASLSVAADSRAGHAGRIELRAAQGTVDVQGELLGSASAGFSGGQLVVDAQSFGDFASLNRRLNSGGFTGLRDLRQRGAGDLVVAAGADDVVRAEAIRLTADGGSIRVDGTIDSSGAKAGEVILSARDDVLVNGLIDARALERGNRGGHVELRSTDGGVLVDTESRVDVSSAGAQSGVTPRGGEVLVRVQRDAALSVLDPDASNHQLALRGAVIGAERLTVEAYQAYTDPDGVIAADDVAGGLSNPLYADASTFMDNSLAIRQALGRDGDPTFRLTPGVEIRSDADLTLSADWNLSSWWLGGPSGVLTLRAAGDLLINSSLNDGFEDAFSNSLIDGAGDSWSYRLIGGADLDSSNVLAVQASNPRGDVTLASNVRVRTGTGNIEVSAGGNFTLTDQTSVLYTAGVASETGILPIGSANQGGLAGSLRYPVNGGDITIDAGGDIEGARTDQLVTAWLWRTGRPEDGLNPLATAWTVNFQHFQQNVGALAGGDVAVRAGGSIHNFSAVIPTVGRQISGSQARESMVEVVGGGDLSVVAGGDIRGGSFYIGRGVGHIGAGGALTHDGRLPQEQVLNPILALGDGTFDVAARRNLTLEAVVNPTLLPQGRAQLAQPNFRNQSYFSTYTDDSRVSLTSTAGDLTLLSDSSPSGNLALGLGSLSFNVGTDDRTVSLRVYPPTLRAAALSGDVEISRPLTLFPSPRGNLELFADRDLRIGQIGGAEAGQILFSDVDPAVLPRIDRPSTNLALVTSLLVDPGVEPVGLFADFNADVPVHSRERRDAGDPAPGPIRLVARQGSILHRSDPAFLTDTSLLYFAKPARIVAGEDIRDLSVTLQHTASSDISSILAGRDIAYSIGRSDSGVIQGSNRAISVDGPGTLALHAGRHLDLQTSAGVTTRGNRRNTSLPDSGASVSVITGLNGHSPDYAGFIDEYLEAGSAYGEALVEYVRQLIDDGVVNTEAPLNEDEALELFRSLAPARQSVLLERILLAEIKAGGRSAAQPGPENGDFTRAFSAMETYFPGSNPDVDSGEQNAYEGDARLFFSRIYTLDGGDVNVLAPGGEINVGLAAPPAAFGITKAPSQLGIVAQSTGSINALAYRDFQVNESRVFAADGGNILVWSTRGDIDAGRGAKTAISAPPPIFTVDENGQPIVIFPPALTGSGIQTLATSAATKPGNVDLYAPRGVVNAGDAGIVAGNLTIAATAVLGADNIQVSGISVGVPVDAGGLAAGLAGVSNVASSASSAAADVVADSRDREESQAPLAEAALGWLDVFVEGFGEEVCKPTDAECLRREREREEQR